MEKQEALQTFYDAYSDLEQVNFQIKSEMKELRKIKAKLKNLKANVYDSFIKDLFEKHLEDLGPVSILSFDLQRKETLKKIGMYNFALNSFAKLLAIKEHDSKYLELEQQYKDILNWIEELKKEKQAIKSDLCDLRQFF